MGLEVNVDIRDARAGTVVLLSPQRKVGTVVAVVEHPERGTLVRVRFRAEAQTALVYASMLEVL